MSIRGMPPFQKTTHLPLNVDRAKQGNKITVSRGKIGVSVVIFPFFKSIKKITTQVVKHLKINKICKNLKKIKLEAKRIYLVFENIQNRQPLIFDPKTESEADSKNIRELISDYKEFIYELEESIDEFLEDKVKNFEKLEEFNRYFTGFIEMSYKTTTIMITKYHQEFNQYRVTRKKSSLQISDEGTTIQELLSNLCDKMILPVKNEIYNLGRSKQRQ